MTLTQKWIRWVADRLRSMVDSMAKMEKFHPPRITSQETIHDKNLISRKHHKRSFLFPVPLRLRCDSFGSLYRALIGHMANLLEENDEVLPWMMSKRLICRYPGLVPETYHGCLHSFKARLLHALVVLSKSSGYSVACLPVCIRAKSKDIRDICQDRGISMCPAESSNCCEYGES